MTKKLIKKNISLFFILLFALSSCSEPKISKLEQKYIDELHNWIKSGNHNEASVRSIVQFNCSKLTMTMANENEVKSFIDKSNIDEYDFRTGFCMSAVVENVWPNQPGFTKKFKKSVCKEKIPLINLICKEFI